jgi:hypothetical protein
MTYSFACTMACFVNDDWEIIKRVVDFNSLAEKEHQGLYGGKAFVNSACSVGSLDKIGVPVFRRTHLRS